MRKLLYVEVSAPGTGKTTRLLKAVEEYLDANKSNLAAVIAESESFARRLFTHLVVSRPVFRQRLRYDTSMRGCCLPNERAFVDDFERMRIGDILLDPGGYYTTSPERVHYADEGDRDLLIRLQREAGDNFHSFGYGGDWEPLRR